ncbi:hypothetical protein NW762_004039 [Fusarium torreyae]|uniref:Cell wall glycoprotein n=1 Tax=Fusarium torreyae TaxID=1237075 RepID=A0A9W8S6R9_9HYPO|nr:hypothetical protein NW762_004039 [Fusarium torreyae]
MVSNTRSVIFGLMLGAAQLSNALPSASEVAFSSPVYPTATDSIPPPAPTDDCVKKCNDAHDKCQTAPDANQATCAAEYSECLGYNPYEGTFVEPTACSAASSAVKPTATNTAPVTDDCVKKCDDAHDKCNTAPDANHAECAAEYAECLGYNPYESGNLVAPTACSAASSAMKPTGTETASSTATAPVSDDCVKKCNDAHDKCQTAPDANQATCAAEYAQCLGYNPYESGSLVPPTACSAATGVASSTAEPTGTETAVIVNGAGHATPAKIFGAVGAVGAAALAFF